MILADGVPGKVSELKIKRDHFLMKPQEEMLLKRIQLFLLLKEKFNCLGM